jgi:ATP-grasp domain
MLTMNNKRFLILNRWDDEFAEYHKYVDHSVNSVAYITTQAGLSRIERKNSVAIEVLEAIEPSLALFEAAQHIANQLGGLDSIVCLSEFDLLTAAQLRVALAVPGLKPDTVRRFKDKTVMKTAVLAANIPTPHYVEASDREAVESLVVETNFPIILKPKIGAASQGVRRIDNQEQLNQVLAEIDTNSFECEQYIPGSIYHVDGLVRLGKLQIVKPSRYINTCYGFAQGEPLGSVLMNPSPKTEKLVSFTDACLKALELSDGAFHLEIIENQCGELYFLEIGARVGGGEIPFIYRDLFGIDLIGEWLRIEFDLPPINLSGANKAVSGGFLMVPEPRNTPCRVVSTTSLINTIPEIYREFLPQPGDVLDGKGGYEHISGRFHFQGTDELAVESAIRTAIDRFRINVVSIL